MYTFFPLHPYKEYTPHSFDIGPDHLGTSSLHFRLGHETCFDQDTNGCDMSRGLKCACTIGLRLFILASLWQQDLGGPAVQGGWETNGAAGSNPYLRTKPSQNQLIWRNMGEREALRISHFYVFDLSNEECRTLVQTFTMEKWRRERFWIQGGVTKNQEFEWDILNWRCLWNIQTAMLSPWYGMRSGLEI